MVTLLLAGGVIVAASYGLYRFLTESETNRLSRGKFQRKPSGDFSRTFHRKSEVDEVSSQLQAKRRISTDKSVQAIKRSNVSKKTVEWIPGLRVREQRILDLMERGKPARLSELSPRFKNVTDRTLRRDMERLIKKGKVKRVGTTRSTTYVKL